MSKLTVFIPAYNAGPWIEATVRSVLSQTYADFELLVIDDGSTDDTVERVRAIQDPRIRLVLNEQNRGIVATRNRALDLVTTPWLACLDADDLAVPERLALQMAYLAQHPQTVVLGGQGEYFGDMTGRAKYPVGERAVRARLPFDNPFMQNTVVLNVDWLRDRGLRYSETARYCEDFDFWAQIAQAGGVITNLPDVLVHYRIHGASTSRSRREVQEQMGNRIRQRQLARLGCLLTAEELQFLDRYQFEGSVFMAASARAIARELAAKLRGASVGDSYEIGRFICSALPRPQTFTDKLWLALSMVTCLPREGTVFVQSFLLGRS